MHYSVLLVLARIYPRRQPGAYLLMLIHGLPIATFVALLLVLEQYVELLVVEKHHLRAPRWRQHSGEL
eukprot:10292761-Prorocentrum_lima.AAC.1